MKKWLEITKNTFSKFMDDRGLKFSAALAYYTIFSLPPLLLMIIGLGSFFYGKSMVQGEIFNQMSSFVGANASKQIQEVLAKTSVDNNGLIATVISFVVLVIGASSMFGEIQDSMNIIWGLKSKPQKGVAKFLFNRLLSFSMIIVLGFILLVSLLLNAILGAFITKLSTLLPEGIANWLFLFDYAIMVSVIALLFTAIFKVLPDAKIKIKDVIVGALVTTGLFLAGKFLIGFYLKNYANASAYGAAGSIILILLWVYYTSIILYLGAEFTHAYVKAKGKKIEPYSYAIWEEEESKEKKEEVTERKKTA